VPDPFVRHIGRSFSNRNTSPDCQEHPRHRAKTIRQSHLAEECPAKRDQHQLAADSEGDVEPAPRTLLGWTVPSHIEVEQRDDGYVHAECQHSSCSAGLTTSVQNGEWIGQFLRSHAHGQVVEHREEEERHDLVLTSGLSGCAGRCTCGGWTGGGRHELPSRVAHRWDAEHLTSLPLEQADPVVEHQPAADSEGRKYHAQVVAEGARDAAYAERDRLQARIDRALALLSEEPWPVRSAALLGPLTRILRGEEES
jgi:hypothetical protein